MSEWNQMPFAGDPWIGKKIETYRNSHNIKLCIETGTQAGFTTRALAELFVEVWSIEINPDYHSNAKISLADLKNIRLLLGESSSVLDYALPPVPLNEPVLFYLDAHGFGSDCALNRELEAVAMIRAGRVNVLVIHDFVVPGRPDLGFDTYDAPISEDYIKARLLTIYPNGYSLNYNDVAEGGMRGCAFISPR